VIETLVTSKVRPPASFPWPRGALLSASNLISDQVVVLPVVARAHPGRCPVMCPPPRWRGRKRSSWRTGTIWLVLSWRCCVEGSWGASSRDQVARSHCFEQLGERGGDSLGGCCFGGEFVVSAAEVLHEGVPGDDHLCGPIRL
jgi:hypothetical protein